MKNNVLIIAEAGVNHNGSLEMAKQLVDAALEAGADIVKFQTFKAENLVTKNAAMANYQVANIGKEDSQLAMLKALELKESEFLELQAYCEKKKIRFFSTGFDLESLSFLKGMKMGLWKVPSGEITNLPYLEFIGACKEQVILSTGMSTLNEIEDAIKILLNAGTRKSELTVLHCNSDYPTAFEDVHLNAMKTIGEKFNVGFGYSDHTTGIEVAIAAVALGATVIEKHFTLDKNLPGPDHKASLNPSELKDLVRSIRNIQSALGRSEKIPTERESKNISLARKSIVASRDIKEGEIFSSENLTTKRPADGVSPMKWHEVVGTKAKRDFYVDEKVEI